MKKLTDDRMAELRRQAKDSDQTADRFWHYIYADLAIAEFCRINGLTAEAAEQTQESISNSADAIEAGLPPL